MIVSKPKTIQTKFLAGLAAIALIGGLLFSSGLYFHLRGLLETEVSSKAELILAQVEAVRTYVRNTLRPTMYGILPEGDFLIEGMSTSYVSRQVMENVDIPQEDFNYRRVAINARNPKFEATAREIKMIQYFREHPLATKLARFERVGDEQVYVTARPVIFSESCMSCHGVSTDDAPKVLLDRYGHKRGFGHTLNSVAGVTSVTMSVESALLRIKGATMGYVFAALIGTLICFGIVNLLFNRVVVHNLKRVLDVFPRYLGKQAHTTLYGRLDTLSDETDEIDEIMRSVEELASNLSNARKELENYATNLKEMVDERTEDLSREALERHADVLLFVSILRGLNFSQTRRELIETALPLIGKRYRTREAAFVCTQVSQNFYSWPTPGIRPALPDNWGEVLMEGEPIFTYNAAYIPVQASDAALEGFLCLFWDEHSGVEPGQMRDVLVALGRQLGIAMENLNALDNLLSQNDVLESIFEGIADPLLLMDGTCNIVLANEAARNLAQSEALPGSDADTLLARLFGIDPEKGELCPLKQVLRKGHPLTYETELPNDRTFSLNIYPLPGADEGSGRVVVYARESTAEKQMLARLQQNEKLVTVGKLAAGLAHEINNPLGVILCYAELLRTSAKTKQEEADVDVIIRHTQQAQRVMQDLLNFARPRKATSGPCAPESIIPPTAEVFSVQAEKRGGAISVDMHSPLPEVAIGPEALEQIMSNLIINAIDAVSESSQAGEIHISAWHEPDASEVIVRIADNGPGIAQDALNRVFDPFFTTKEVGQGTGLGLAVVYGIVSQTGGRIETHNESGAVFTLALPVAQAEGVPASES